MDDPVLIVASSFAPRPATSGLALPPGQVVDLGELQVGRVDLVVDIMVSQKVYGVSCWREVEWRNLQS